jgi:hypothetical protein
MTHSSSRRGSLPGNKTDNWKVAIVVLTEPLGCGLLGFPADFSDHKDALGLLILDKFLKHINEGGADERITTDTHDS